MLAYAKIYLPEHRIKWLGHCLRPRQPLVDTVVIFIQHFRCFRDLILCIAPNQNTLGSNFTASCISVIVTVIGSTINLSVERLKTFS